MKDLEKGLGDFEIILQSMKLYRSNINEELEKVEVDFEVVEHLPITRRRMKKKMFAYEGDDDPITNENNKFHTGVFTSIKDTILSTFKKKFKTHDALFANFSCLNPNRFPKLRDKLSVLALTNLFSRIKRFREESPLQNF